MRNDVSNLLDSYDLNPAAQLAVECMRDMEFLCRRIRKSLKKRSGSDESGMPQAERLIVEAYELVWEEVQDRWKVTGEVEPVSIQQQHQQPALHTEPFYW